MSLSRSSSHLLQFNNESGCLCLCGLKFKRRKDVSFPDNLRNWKLWMQRRRHVHRILAKRLKCDAGDLVMNSGDICRSIKEEKLVLEYTKIEKHFDKYRGNPDFWKFPCCLKSLEPPYEDSEYYLFKPKEAKNEIPVIEYVGVPDFILEEKNIVPRTRHLKILWNKSSYREQVQERVSEKLLEIEPHKPDLSNLIILGSNLGPPTKEAALRKDPSLHKSPKSSKNVKQETRSFTEESDLSLPTVKFKRLALKINDREFNKYSGIDDNKDNKISVMFEYFTGSIVPSQQSIVFENIGQAALRLYWKPYKKLKIFREYIDDTKIFHPFKFVKSEVILLPGTRTVFPIWFQVAKPGNYFEYWELTCLPKIWKNDFRLVILLKGFAFIRDYDHRLQHVSEKLRQMVRNTTIKDLFSDMLSRGIYCAPGTIRSFDFSEEELFESANLVKHISVQTPKYFYNPAVIAELKGFYEDIKCPDDPEQWNFSIKKLRENARKRDLFSYFETKLTLYETAKLKRQSLQENVADTQDKPGAKREKEITKKEKVHKESSLEPLDKTTQKTNYYNKLHDILRKLEKPSIYLNKERKKYLFSSTVLKTFFWKMFDRLDQLLEINLKEPSIESDISDEPLKIKQSAQVPDRLLYETFDEGYILRTKRISQVSGLYISRPKPLVLKGISASDVKKVFKMYFSKDETNLKGAKGKTEASEPKKAAVKPQKNKPNINQAEDMYHDIDDCFDPFSEEFPSKFEATATTQEPPAINQLLIPKKTNEEKYLIVYVTLCDAVDALVDTIEACNEQIVPGDVLGELQRCSNVLYQYHHKTAETISAEIHQDYEDSNALTKESLPSEKAAESMTVDSQADYFEFLQELHWQSNLNTKKYFVDEKQKGVVDTQTSSSLVDIIDIGKIKRSLSNVFSLEDFRRKPEPYSLKDRSAQTDASGEDYGPLLIEPTPTPTTSQRRVSVQSGESSRNIFYFLSHGDDKESNVTTSTIGNGSVH